jgi:hypothetical protein
MPEIVVCPATIISFLILLTALSTDNVESTGPSRFRGETTASESRDNSFKKITRLFTF